MWSESFARVTTAGDLLARLAETPPRKRFRGTTSSEFEAWRDMFLPWLRERLARHAPADDRPDAPPEFERQPAGEWEGLRRTELRFANPGYDAVVPATVLEPPVDRRNGAAVLCLHGHGRFGRLSVAGDRRDAEVAGEIDRLRYDYGRHLAEAGYATFAFDLLNFGDRALETIQGRDRCDFLGLLALMGGLNPMALIVSDARRALSILAGWEGVDAERLGVCGLSLGGRSTMFVAASDDRVRVAVAAGANNTYRDRIFLRRGACGVQIAPGILLDADTPDIFGALAPRPLQIQWGMQDGGVEPAAAEAGHEVVSRCYAAAGARERYERYRFEGGHQCDLDAARRWFDRWL